MSKALVLYYSDTGNTEKMAYFVYKGAKSIPGVEVRLRSIEEADMEDIKWCDGIALGAPTNFGCIPWKMKKWWDDKLELWSKIDGKFGTVFSSSGGWGGGAEINCLSMLTLLMNFGILTFGITDYVGLKFSGHYGAVLAGEPIADHERDACIRLGMRLAEWCSYYVDNNEDAHPLKQDYDRLPPEPPPVKPIVNYEEEIAKAKKES